MNFKIKGEKTQTVKKQKEQNKKKLLELKASGTLKRKEKMSVRGEWADC